ncbi:hypothetical protein ZWY2020_018013 [Hordeum vulgare]|nr:hypothetical protein ZWY2020_018013 [Hordeum vulgare]
MPAVLRPCVYRPPRTRLVPAAGVLAAFVVSGLVHELMFYPPGRTWWGRPPGRRRPSSFDDARRCGGGVVGEAPGVVAPAAAGCHPINSFPTPQQPPRHRRCDFFPAASAASSATGCYLFWTMELDLLDLEPVQILPQLLPMEQ